MIIKNALLIATLILPLIALPAAHQSSHAEESAFFTQLTQQGIGHTSAPGCAVAPEMTPQAVEELFNTCLATQDPHDIYKLTTCLGRTKTLYTKYEHSFLIEAIRTNKLSVAKAIIQRCPHYYATGEECYNEGGDHPLHFLVAGEASPEDPVLRECIDLLAPYVNLLNNTGETPLMTAKHPTIAAHLIARGADVYATSDNDCTALSTHIAFTNLKMVKFLRTQDASITLSERKEHLSQAAHDALDLHAYAVELAINRAVEDAFDRAIEDIESHLDDTDSNQTEEPEPLVAILHIDAHGARAINRAHRAFEAADQIATLMQKPVTDAERIKATNRIKQFLNLTSKRLLERETNSRILKRSRRS